MWDSFVVWNISDCFGLFLLHEHLREKMGQAKKRGTFEERKRESINKKNKEEERKREELLLWWNSLSEEEQKEHMQKEHQSKTKLSNLLSIASLFSQNI
jgi:hypothetical protein